MGLLPFSPHIHLFSQKERTEQEVPPRVLPGWTRGKSEQVFSRPPAPAVPGPGPRGCWPYVAEGVRPVPRGVDVAGRGGAVAFGGGRVGDDGRLPGVAGAHPDRWKAGTAGERGTERGASPWLPGRGGRQRPRYTQENAELERRHLPGSRPLFQAPQLSRELVPGRISHHSLWVQSGPL